MRKKPQKNIKIEDLIGDQPLHPIRLRDIDQQAKQIFEQEHRRQQLIEQQKVQQLIDPNRNNHQSSHAHSSHQQQSILHNSSAQQTNSNNNNNNHNSSHTQFLLSPTGRKSVRIQERGSISSGRLPLASDRQPNAQSFQVESSTNLTNSSVLLLPPKQFKTPLAKSSQYLSILSKSHSNTKYLNSSKVLLSDSVSQSAQKLSTQISDNPNSGDQLQQQEQSGLKVSISTGSLLGFAATNPNSRKKPKILGGQAYPLQQDLSSGHYLQFLESIKSKLINQQQQINDEQFFDKLGNAVEYALARIQQLEEAARIDQKQIVKLQALNAYLQISNKKKEQIYEEAVKENVAIKQQLKVLQDSMRKRQEKQQQADQKQAFIGPSSNTDIKDSNQFYYALQQSANPSLPTNNNNNYNQLINEDHTPSNNERSQQPYQSTSSQQQPNSSSQETFTSALLQQTTILPLQAQQFDTPRAVADSSEESQGDMQNNNTSNMEGDQSIQTPATPAGLENFQDEEYIRKMRFNFVQHSTDFYFFSLLLDLTISKRFQY